MNKLFLIKISFFILIFSFISSYLSAANDTLLSKTSIGFIFSPELSNAVSQSGLKPKLSYNLGFNINYKLNPNFALGCGLYFNNRGYKEHLDSTNYYSVYDSTQHKYIKQKNINEPSSIKYSYNDHFLEIPVFIKYYIKNINRINNQNKFKLYLTTGVSFNYLIYSTLVSENYYESGEKLRERILQDVNGSGFKERFKLGIFAGIGLQYHLKKFIYVNIEPVYRFYLAPLSDLPSLTKINTVGINIGMFYNFKSSYKSLPN